ncbi:UNVERIFIED_CONTAM: hypothetical protein K2H54_033237 [Gekko kuhli]
MEFLWSCFSIAKASYFLNHPSRCLYLSLNMIDLKYILLNKECLKMVSVHAFKVYTAASLGRPDHHSEDAVMPFLPPPRLLNLLQFFSFKISNKLSEEHGEVRGIH